MTNRLATKPNKKTSDQVASIFIFFALMEGGAFTEAQTDGVHEEEDEEAMITEEASAAAEATRSRFIFLYAFWMSAQEVGSRFSPETHSTASESVPASTTLRYLL